MQPLFIELSKSAGDQNEQYDLSNFLTEKDIQKMIKILIEFYIGNE
jgi:hypothetical protein